MWIKIFAKKCCINSCWIFNVTFIYLLFETVSGQFLSLAASCDRSRKILTDEYGQITDGLNSNYTQDSHCEWLIKAQNNSQFITLKFHSIRTECSYDYVFVYDGNSYRSRLLGSFSGKSEHEQQVVATSGYMLILLYSDTNYVLDGFKAEYIISNCLNNCSNQGVCVNHTCVCSGNWTGKDCSYAPCPNNCGIEEEHGECDKNVCKCKEDYSGQECSLHKYHPKGNEWHWISSNQDGFLPRAAHSAIYNEQTDSLYIFGGYNLNDVLGALQVFHFKTNTWENENGQLLSSDYNKLDTNFLKAALHEPESKILGLEANPSFLRNALHGFTYINQGESQMLRSKRTERLLNFNETLNYTSPLPRYGHTAVALNDGFVIFGGKLANGSLTNDLWTYNISKNVKWKLRAQKSEFSPPKLTRHTLTLVDSTLYLLGGSMTNGEFSSRLFKIKLSSNENEEQWEEIFPRGGKTLDIRVVAHTTVYHKDTNSLIVYGGVVAGVARFSKLSDRMFSFHLEKLHWTEILYPRSPTRETYIPRERAFHTTSVIGNYLIVFGGYSHRHNKEEICYDNQMYLYHLGCHIWVNQEVLGINPKSKYPKKQGIFAHASAIRRNHTLLLIGGYHGNINNDLIAYTLPPMLVKPNNPEFQPESLCPKHLTVTECISDPECGWCSADGICYGRTIANCTTNLQTTRCPGLCPALGDCRSCLIHGASNAKSTINLSVANKLGLGHCAWCVQNARCHHRDNYGCGDNYGSDKGWWGPKGIEISENVLECTKLDRPPGLVFLKYLYPVNWRYPDYVSIVNSTMVDFNIPNPGTLAEQSFNGDMVARLLGFIRPPLTWKASGEMLRVCASFSQVTLKVGIQGALQANILAANLTTELTQCILAHWQQLDNPKILVDLQAKRRVGNLGTTHQFVQPSKVGLQHNRSSETARAFTFEYLEPYSNGNCQTYQNCLQCLSDQACGWCDLTQSCMSRNENDTISCSKNNFWKYLILQPSQCTNCSNFISCEQCLDFGMCEWWAEDARCARKGRWKSAIAELSECPAPCHLRKNCSTCLNEKGRCVWCEATSECFSFSIYTSEYQFGLCREWLDQVSPTLSPSEIRNNVQVQNKQQCKSCSDFSNCTTCLKSLNCGWCFNSEYPIEGACVSGDFNQSFVPCNEIINSTIENSLWAYAQCPDVNECELKIHDCHENAICTNTHGSYVCECQRGFIGDGRRKCDQTCYETCRQGHCSNAPNYVCECDLGWTGVDCSINCGCHNHSTCNHNIGKCDKCQSWTYTTGEFCEHCVIGSYGDATKDRCIPCNCNGHGNVSRGICDTRSGQCYCQDNTEGMNCEICSRQYYGDPANGGNCYLQCESRAILKNVHQQGIGSYQSAADTQECLWILKLDQEMQDPGALIHLEIEREHMNVSCKNNAIWVFNGVPEFTNNAQQKQISNIFCNENNSPWVIEESRTGELAVYFKQGSKGQGFNAMITIFSCKFSTCYSPYICDGNQRCVCPHGFTGERCAIEICPNNCYANLSQGTCDVAYGRCICFEGYGDVDCSRQINSSAVILNEIFNTQLVSESFEHLKTQIPRFGHTLVIDRRGSLWMFGGYSLTHGALNDIRQFDTKNNTWMQVTVDSTPEAKMPQGRYFHASAILLSKQTIYTFGGLNLINKNKSLTFLNDFWEFNIQNQRWKEVEVDESKSAPIPLAGHTLTLIKDVDKESLLLIGGCSNITHFDLNNGIWEFNLNTKKWIKITTTGSIPVGIFGHSTSYQSSSQVLYIFGGYQMTDNKMQISKKLYAFNYNKLEWSELPIFGDLNRPEENLPRARFLHSAISTEHYMIVYGGQSVPYNSSDFINAYNYRCNSWVRLTEDAFIVGKTPSPTYGQAMVFDTESNIIFVAGGKDNSHYKIITIQIPMELCQLWSPSKFMCRRFMGCSFCTVSTNVSKTSHCFTNGVSDACDPNQGSSTFNYGTDCDDSYISKRNCSEMKTCTSCLAAFPSHSENSPVCQWCGEDSESRCIESKYTCEHQKTTGLVNQCEEVSCAAFDCNNCISKTDCNWVKNENLYLCVSSAAAERKNLETITTCPKKCDEYFDCTSCLNATSSEGGWNECLWSTKLSKCISPSYQALYCAGGICGLVVTSDNKNQCPRSCETFDQCSKCLQNAHCGWCSIEGQDGQGICVEGSLNKPAKDQLQETCRSKYFEYNNFTHIDHTFSWNYVKCPPENECNNNHHNCNPQSEKCIDLLSGFKCDCSEGYRMSLNNQKCIPVCQQGCVRGSCVEPNYCKCDFGYVGKNCSIQCSCNGHSNCGGPDKLDECLECHNNTMGNQCEKCKPFFVGDPRNNRNCISCRDYCHGHTDICVAKEMEDLVRNMTRTEIERDLSEGPKSEALCLYCANNTDGQQCDTCILGHFRGTSTLTSPCRSCECGGHGNMCDPITGEKCNCGNNTESDTTCSTKKNSVKNSIYLCWMSQCSKCRESYSGHPKNFGHQCYKHITIDSKFCLDAKSLDECKAKPQALKTGQTVFFVVQPRFMNVDIRIILDVTQGELDFYMSSNDDSFVVFNNQSTGLHEMYLDGKYNWIQEMSDNEFIDHLKIFPSNYSSKKINHDDIPSPQGYIDDRHAPPTPDCKTLSGRGFYVQDRKAEDLSTYITLTRCNTLIRVFQLKNRLVLTLPQNVHNLSGTRFYIALRAGSNAPATYGLIFFRQDQLHIDLFVFFSVFFSCFFLVLAVCVILWKAKHAADIRRARRRHVVEMLHMAQRPFSAILLDISLDDNVHHHRKNRLGTKSKTPQNSSKQNYMPVAFEPTSDNQAGICTIFIRLPGKKSGVCLGSSLISTPKNNMFMKPPLRHMQQQMF